VKTEPPVPAPTRRKRWPLRVGLLLLLTAIGYGGWREYDFRHAIQEAKAAKLEWSYEDPFDVIRKDYRKAFQLATWTSGERALIIDDEAGYKIARARNLLHRLRPRTLSLTYYENPKNLEALKGLNSLRHLEIDASRVLLNDISVLQSLPLLETLAVDFDLDRGKIATFKTLTGLKALVLTGEAYYGCDELQFALPKTKVTAFKFRPHIL
jgi:hypothetical protein